MIASLDYIYFSRAKILEGLDDFIVANPNLELETWKHTIMSKVDAKIDSLRTNINPRHTNPVLQQSDVQDFHNVAQTICGCPNR